MSRASLLTPEEIKLLALTYRPERAYKPWMTAVPHANGYQLARYLRDNAAYQAPTGPFNTLDGPFWTITSPAMLVFMKARAHKGTTRVGGQLYQQGPEAIVNLVLPRGTRVYGASPEELEGDPLNRNHNAWRPKFRADRAYVHSAYLAHSARPWGGPVQSYTDPDFFYPRGVVVRPRERPRAEPHRVGGIHFYFNLLDAFFHQIYYR